MAIAFENGSLAVWDMHAKVLKHKFTSHSLACTAIAFSPVNNLLMCSVGLDCRVIFYDIHEHREVKTINAATATASLSFCSDGHTIAIGSETNGTVTIYDLKEPKKVKI
jgi:WD40 repeat protein